MVEEKTKEQDNIIVLDDEAKPDTDESQEGSLTDEQLSELSPEEQEMAKRNSMVKAPEQKEEGKKDEGKSDTEDDNKQDDKEQGKEKEDVDLLERFEKDEEVPASEINKSFGI